jgi:lysophospholipase L1-like esterase
MNPLQRLLRAAAPLVALTCLLHVASAADLRIPASDDGLPGDGPIRRADWFQKHWLQRREGWDTRREADRHALVFVGDSITEGWGGRLQQAFPGIKVANRGISGDTSRGVLVRLQHDVLDLAPIGVVLLIGTNDIEEKASPETIAGNIRLILEALRVHNPSLPVIVCDVFPSSASMRRPQETIRRLNALIAKVTPSFPNVTRLETWQLFANPQGDARPAEFPDLLHLNQDGYTRWADALRPILATLGFLETEPDTFAAEPGFTSLFNGRDLSGWGFKTNEFSGLSRSPEGRYLARNGRLVVGTPPEGRRFDAIWTSRSFSNDFVLKLEFRATPYADSGIFLRKPQLQCRDYLIAGPYTNLARYKPQQWNEIIVAVTNGVAHCTCNGEVIERALQLPPSGPIGLEGDRGQMEYRRIRIHERR